MATILYFSHGGGPLPILGDSSHAAMVAFMRDFPRRFPRPEAIVVVSAHWEEPVPTLSSGAMPSLIYDYFGFPQEAYSLSYPSPGHPVLAGRIADFFSRAGIGCRQDPERGFDHGHFIPLLLMYPKADIPSIQLSLARGLDPRAHLNIGAALRPLREENILFIGSGFSFHNMRAFSWSDGSARDPENEAFQDWLSETCAGNLDYPQIEARLEGWKKAPAARYCHPREEHLPPLHVCAGLAGDPGEKIFDDSILGKRALAFQW
ncbi:MAG: extradiol ring-cleavage dioxygenase class III protein subunit B [Spirochaetes bacterium]|nr:MAG: extradiol ring-cleavage dioxygenase class III protein subunit B [Spirochaetota bacterium]